MLDDYEDGRAEQVLIVGGGRSVPEMEVIVESAMQTPDRLWRVEVVRPRGRRTSWYRIVRGDDDAVLDWLSITAVERILTEAGVDLATLVPVLDDAVDPQQGEGPEDTHGAA